MDKLPVGQLPDLASSNNDDEIMVITNSEYNQLKKEKISDLITDFTSTNENNALTKGTDGKMFVTDFGNASNITEGTLPVSVLPDIPKDLLPEIETADLPVSGVSADTYAYPSSVTVNAQGQVTAIEEGTPSGANADTDLSNLTEEGEKHFLNKTQITNCILEAPNGVATYSGNTITVKQGLKVLIPNGRNADGTLNNIEYTVPSDITRTFTGGYSDTFYLRINENGGFNDHSISLQSNVNTLSEAPTPAVGKYYEVYVVSENNVYYSNNGADYKLNNACKIAIYTTTADNRITSLTPFTTFRAIDYNDTEFMAHQAMPSDKYVNLSLQASGATYTAPADGYFVLSFTLNNPSTRISFSQIISDGPEGRVEGVASKWVGENQVGRSTTTGFLPARKGQDVIINYNPGSVVFFRFIYAQGVQ